MHKQKISHTAWLVLLCQLGLARQERWKYLVSEDNHAFYQHCYDYCRAQFFLYRIIHFLISVSFHLWIIEKALAFGAAQHFVLRKKAIERQVVGSISGGVKQIVVMGAGFDALAVLNSRKFPHVIFFEIDTPAMHSHKKNILHSYEHGVPQNLYLLGNDFSKYSLMDLLSNCPDYSSDKPTAFIAEGVLMYLQESTIAKVFDDIKKLAPYSADFVFTAIEPAVYNQSAGWKKFQQTILNISGESFCWRKLRTEMPRYLAGHGFFQQSQHSYADLQHEYRLDAEMEILERVNGEYLVVAKSL